jgi:hypothetical protein
MFMKTKTFVLGLLLSSLVAWGSGGVSAQGFYFDIGLGAGGAWTEIDGNNVSKILGVTGVDEAGVDIGLKAGYGPVGDIPMYIVGELAGIGHRFYDSSNYIQYNSYLIGGGVIFYPVSFLQLAGDIGFSTTANTTDIRGVTMDNSEGGFAYNISAAFDIGKNKHGALLGARYFGAVNTLKETDLKQEQGGLNVFVKYAYRHKAKKLQKQE